MRNSIVEKAREYLGVRWRHQGRNRFGIDCAGLVIVVANELELSDFDTGNYARRTSGEPFCHHFRKAGMFEIDKADLKVGDVVLTEDKSFPCHCGFIGSDKRGRLTFIHAYAKRRKVIEEPLEHWRAKISHAMRFPQLRDEG